MLISIKSLHEDLFTVEAEPSHTILHFKENIQKVKGDVYPAKYTKLMFAGKILLDNKRICDYGLKKRNLLYWLLKRLVPKLLPINGEAPDLSQIQFTTRERELILMAEHERLADLIVDLGFSREVVEEALRDNHNNVSRAIEAIVHSISASVNAADGRNYDAAIEFLEQIMQSVSPENSFLPTPERIADIFSEAVAECDTIAREQDDMIEANHEAITQNYEELEASGITDPHDIFENFFSNLAPISPEELPSAMFANGMSDLFNEAYNPSGLALAGNLSDSEHAAIERLKELGFAPHKVVEAYFTCGKDENAAAEYLFRQKGG
ncbi:UV excision repair protein RAD23 [Caerostris extrusa]|uniref:UV excision repair protein RAD23 n=1 Tax=Caerostris extrusa TaxID=172846 RepID=A0AAV4N572_CAEEX|nr:UV excision repair protein RAD23 [Caerostris extrusa]